MGTIASAAEDKWEIAETLARYCFAVDLWDWEQLDTVFARDATAHYDMEAIGFGSVHLDGRAEIVAWLAASIPALGPAMPRHAMTNHLFDMNGDAARTRSALNAGGPGGGIYTADHVRTERGWRVKHFHLRNFKRNPAQPIPVDDDRQNRLMRLEAEAAIAKLIATYAGLLDTNDLGGVGRLLKDAVITFADRSDEVRGEDNIARMYAEFRAANRPAVRTGPVRHVTTNIAVALDPALASATSRSYFLVLRQTAGKPVEVMSAGCYEDAFDCAGGAWRFVSRRMIQEMSAPGPQCATTMKNEAGSIIPDTAITTRLVTADGLTFETLECGAGDRLVLCLHGFPSQAVCWRDQLPALAALGYRAWAPNQRGYGRSSRPIGAANYTVEKLLGDIAAIIDASGATSTILVAHDWGGLLAWFFAARRIRPLEKLIVLNAPHPACAAVAYRKWRQMRKGWYILAFQIPWIPDVLLRFHRAWLLQWLMLFVAGGRKVFTAETLAFYRNAAAAPGAVTAMLSWYRGMLRGGVPPETAGKCPVIETPTLVIWGDGDVALDVSCLDGLENYVSNLTIERLPGVSHWVQEEVPDIVNGLIEKFLSRPATVKG